MKEIKRVSIVQDGNPVLRSVAQPVEPSEIGSKKIREVIADMIVALDREQDGVAIAAPQIGVPLRIFVVSHRAFEIDDEQKKVEKTQTIPAPKNMIVINPEITKLSKKKSKVAEGCLSVRWLYGNTMRNDKAAIRALDENGKTFTYGGSGLIAQIFQHETDHLNGILFIDHATEIEELTPEQIAEIESQSKK